MDRSRSFVQALGVACSKLGPRSQLEHIGTRHVRPLPAPQFATPEEKQHSQSNRERTSCRPPPRTEGDRAVPSPIWDPRSFRRPARGEPYAMREFAFFIGACVSFFSSGRPQPCPSLTECWWASFLVYSFFLSRSASQTGRLQTILSIPGVNGSGARQPQTALESTAGDSTSDHYNYQANDSLNRYFVSSSVPLPSIH